MSQPVSAHKVTEKLRPGIDERSCRWVQWHDQREYLLPLVSRKQRITPRFTADGDVLLESQSADAELVQMIDLFIQLFGGGEAIKDADGCTVGMDIWITTEEAYANLFRLARRLILSTYDYTTEEITHLLTVSGDQLRQLVETLFKHLLRQT